MITVGVLAIQGDVYENVRVARQALDDMNIGGRVMPVKTSPAISDVDVMIIPGGESTTIGQMCLTGDVLSTLSERITAGMPTLGICAGMILLANAAHERNMGKTGQPLLGVLDMRLERNSFGRQRRSCEIQLQISALDIDSFRGVFIRAPSVGSVSPSVEPICAVDNRIVAVRQNHIIGTAFHPELAGDTAIHRYLIGLARR